MNCIDFFSGSITERIDSAGAIETPIVFLHIPKTGGTSIQRDLRFLFPESVHIPFQAIRESWPQHRRRIVQLQPELVRGHFNHQHVLDLNRMGFESRSVSFLRDPLDRLISHYFWHRLKCHHGAIPTKLHKSFQSYFERAKGVNPMCKILVGNCHSAQEAIEKVVDKYWFIGVTEFYHVCQSVLMAALGKQYRIRKRLNVSEPFVAERLQLKDAFSDLAREHLAVDFAIFDFFYDQWTKRINETIESLMRINLAHQRSAVLS